MFKPETQKELNELVMKGITHIISVCDTFSYEDYPVYVYEGQNVEDIYKKYNGPNMQKVNEVIKIYDPNQKGGIKFLVAENLAFELSHMRYPEEKVQSLGEEMAKLVLLCTLKMRGEKDA